jgi:rhamnosyltransferase
VVTNKRSEIAIVVPTLNAASEWARFAPALLTCADAGQILIVDSSSRDETVALARALGFKVQSLGKSSFDHGGTRQWAAELLPEAEILVYLTQDAILANPDSLQNLISAFEDPSVGAAFGRQLPRPGAGPIESHARFFNYPDRPGVRTLQDRETLGFKSIFISNSFAAYRSRALKAVGGFPMATIFGEDTIVAGRMLLSGWKIAYAADALVYHSHSYTWAQEFQRYFDIGVLHARESWLLKEFGQTGNEGKRFVLSELRYLWPRHAALIPSALIRTAAKLAGYRIGRIEARLKPQLKRRLSMHRSYWQPSSDC